MSDIHMTSSSRREHWMSGLKEVTRPANRIKYWRQVRQELANEADSILEKAETEDRGLTAGEQKWFDSVKTDLEWIQEKKIRPLEEAEQAAMAGPLLNSPGTADDLRDLRALQQVPFRGRHFAELFGQVPRDSQFQNLDEFLGIISRNQYDPRLSMSAAASGMSETVGADGGFFVPTEYSSRLLDSALEQSVMWGRVRVEPMLSATKTVSSFANEDASAGRPYGLNLQWLDEGGTFSESKALVRSITLNAKKAGIYVPFSRELGEDAPNFAQQLTEAVSSGLGWGIDDSILNGQGAGRLLGVIAAPSTITINKESGQTAGTFLFENAVAMYARMHPACVPNSIWLANPSTMPELLKMSVSLGTSGVWYPALTQQSGVYSLLGRPLFLTEKCAALGAKGDVVFLDPSQYILGLRRGITIALSEHVKFASDEVVLKVTIRLDGMPAWQKPYAPKHGPSTSWAVVLQAR